MDHHFAKTIMYAIKPHVQLKKDTDWNMDMREFIAIFKTDIISENVVKLLNDEVNKVRKEKLLDKNGAATHQSASYE